MREYDEGRGRIVEWHEQVWEVEGWRTVKTEENEVRGEREREGRHRQMKK